MFVIGNLRAAAAIAVDSEGKKISYKKYNEPHKGLLFSKAKCDILHMGQGNLRAGLDKE